MFSFEMFSGIWSLIANVLEHCSFFTGEWVQSVTVVGNVGYLYGKDLARVKCGVFVWERFGSRQTEGSKMLAIKLHMPENILKENI
jgi:hypothetical protein